MTGRGFWTQTGLLAAGQGVYVACQWGMLIALARLAGPAAVGRFALALAVTAPIMLLSNLALRSALVTDVAGEHGVRRYLALRAGTTVLGLLAIGIVVALLPLGRADALLVLSVALAKACENQSDILYGVLQREERFAPIATSLAARGVLGLLAFVLGIRASGDVALGALLLAAAWAAVLVAFDRPACARWRRAGPPAGPPRLWLRLARQVLPLGIAGALITLNASLPRYVIADHLGAAQLGRFAAMAYFVAAGMMLVTVLGQAASPRLARAAAVRDRRAFAQLMATIVLPSAALGALGILLAVFLHRDVMTLFYGAAFAADSSLLTWVMAAGLASYVAACFGYGITALRRFRITPWLYGVSCALTLVGGIAAAPAYGLDGIVIAWAGALACTMLLTGAVNVLGCAAAGQPTPPGLLPRGALR